ncbi:hypothetical protein B0H19DRAFT_1063280 [Mycena capillaripes]|nr:hypothetical protein B0H19DRAFT_1063280 [Mycena capillaripes]
MSTENSDHEMTPAPLATKDQGRWERKNLSRIETEPALSKGFAKRRRESQRRSNTQMPEEWGIDDGAQDEPDSNLFQRRLYLFNRCCSLTLLRQNKLLTEGIFIPRESMGFTGGLESLEFLKQSSNGPEESCEVLMQCRWNGADNEANQVKELEDLSLEADRQAAKHGGIDKEECCRVARGTEWLWDTELKAYECRWTGERYGGVRALGDDGKGEERKRRRHHLLNGP